MGTPIAIAFEKKITVTRSPAESFQYLSHPIENIQNAFPGLATFTQTGPQEYQWQFQKLSYSGYELAFSMNTQLKTTQDTVTHFPLSGKGNAQLQAEWQIQAHPRQGSQLLFRAELTLELPIPRFLKGMAEPLTQKEISKLMEQYVSNVAKDLS